MAAVREIPETRRLVSIRNLVLAVRSVEAWAEGLWALSGKPADPGGRESEQGPVHDRAAHVTPAATQRPLLVPRLHIEGQDVRLSNIQN